MINGYNEAIHGHRLLKQQTGMNFSLIANSQQATTSAFYVVPDLTGLIQVRTNLKNCTSTVWRESENCDCEIQIKKNSSRAQLGKFKYWDYLSFVPAQYQGSQSLGYMHMHVSPGSTKLGLLVFYYYSPCCTSKFQMHEQKFIYHSQQNWWKKILCFNQNQNV